MTIGIYRIKNLINDKCYYGSSKHIEQRFIEHINSLKNNKHVNIILQRAWNKYGESNFICETVEQCDINLLFEKEQKYLDLKPAYNIGITASGGDNLSNNPNRLAIIEKIKNTSQLRSLNMSDEEKILKFSKPLDKNSHWKGGISVVFCKCGNKMSYGSKNCNDCDDRNGKNNSFYNKTHTVESKNKMSKSHLGKEQNHSNVPFTIDNIEYRTLTEAEDKLNIQSATIWCRLKSKNPKYKDYKYIGIEKICHTEEEQKKRFAKSKIGKKLKTNKPFTIDNIEYRTLKEASDILNYAVSTINQKLLNDNPKYDNYKFI